MADEPDSLVLRLLRDIRATQDTQGETLKDMKGRMEELYKISTHTLGVAAKRMRDMRSTRLRSGACPSCYAAGNAAMIA
jgi:hypothetical protein